MNRAGKVTTIFGAAAFGYALAVEPYWIDTVHREIFAPRLPHAFDGFTIYQISDLHMSRLGRRERMVERLLKALPPADLVALTGDLIHTRAGMEPFLDLAKSIRSNAGTYAVFGNSEYKNGVRPLEFARRLSANGIMPLLNQHVILQRGTEEIVLAGVEDPWTDLDDLELAVTGVPDNVFKLVLMHSPDGIAEAVFRGVNLVLSGHTHGGQVIVPFIGPLYTHTHQGRRLSSGHYAGKRLRSVVGVRPGRTQLYITRGLGASGLALRFLCRPEFTIITLRRGIPAARRAPVPVVSG